MKNDTKYVLTNALERLATVCSIVMVASTFLTLFFGMIWQAGKYQGPECMLLIGAAVPVSVVGAGIVAKLLGMSGLIHID